MKRFLLAVFLVAFSGCYHEVRPERPWCHGHGSFWVEGFRDRWGNWHPGHWECR